MALARPAVRGHCLTPTQHPSFPETRGGAWKNAVTPQVSHPERVEGAWAPPPRPCPQAYRAEVSCVSVGGGWVVGFP